MGVPDAFVATIGYHLFSATGTAQGRHLIGQNPPQPGDGDVPGGCARFRLFNSQRVPEIRTHHPKYTCSLCCISATTEGTIYV